MIDNKMHEPAFTDDSSYVKQETLLPDFDLLSVGHILDIRNDFLGSHFFNHFTISQYDFTNLYHF